MPVTVSLFHSTGTPKSSMVNVFLPLLTFVSVLLLYAITPFSGNTNSGAEPPVLLPVGHETCLTCCNLSSPAEVCPADGALQCVPAHLCLTPMLHANENFWCPSEDHDTVCRTTGPLDAGCCTQQPPRAQPVVLSPPLHCPPPPYANTPISAFTPFLQHTASSWVNVSFSPNTVLCALDNLFHKTSHLLPCPPPTTRLPNTGRYSTTPASVKRHSFAKLPTSRFWFATYDSFIECQAHSIMSVCVFLLLMLCFRMLYLRPALFRYVLAVRRWLESILLPLFVALA